MDCIFCESEKSVWVEKEYSYENKEYKVEFPLDLLICHECGAEVFEQKDLELLLTAIREKHGDSYHKFKLENGQVIPYTSH